MKGGMNEGRKKREEGRREVEKVMNPFTSKSDQLQFLLQVTHQSYIIQYGELGF